MSGHANYATKGEDVVCAAVTILSLTTLQSLVDLTEDEIEYDVQPGWVDARYKDLSEKARALIKKRKLPFADQDAVFWSTTSKLLLPRKFNEQSKFNRKDTVVCHFCKRLLLKPYPHTENFKQWNVEEVHNILKCHAFDEDLEEYLKLKDKFESNLREEV